MKVPYLVSQVWVQSTAENIYKNGTNNIFIRTQNAIRKIYAESEEEAIGKFVKEMQTINFTGYRGCEIECFRLIDIKTIK